MIDNEMTDDMLNGCISSSKRKKKAALKKGDLPEYAWQEVMEKFCRTLKGADHQKSKRT